MSSFNSMFVGGDALATKIVELAAELPDQYERVERDFCLVENQLPGGEVCTCLQGGQRELFLFRKGRADLMDFDVTRDGATAVYVPTARAAVPGGRIQYRLGADGLDHLCKTRACDRRIVVTDYKLPGCGSSRNPEALDRRTGSIKTDSAGKPVRTLQYELLVSDGFAYQVAEVEPEPMNSYERGVYLLGAAVQRGGFRLAKPQLNKWAVADQAGAFTNEIGGVHFLEFLGHMCQSALAPVAWFVENQPGYQALPLSAQVAPSMPFKEGHRCLVVWQALLARGNAANLGIFMSSRSEQYL